MDMFTSYGHIIASTELTPTEGICVALGQHRPNVFDAGPALYRCCTDVSSLLGCVVVYFNEHNKNYVYFNFKLIICLF